VAEGVVSESRKVISKNERPRKKRKHGTKKKKNQTMKGGRGLWKNWTDKANDSA